AIFLVIVQQLPGLLLILLQLLNKSINAVKLHFVAQVLKKTYLHLLSVDILLKIKKVNFQRADAFIKSRTCSNIHHPFKPVIHHAHSNGINAIFGNHLLRMLRLDVGRGKADLLPTFLSVNDRSIQPVGTLQKFGSLPDIPFFTERLTDGGAAYRLFSYLFLGDHIGLKTKFAAKHFYRFNSPFTIPTEVMVVADDKFA